MAIKREEAFVLKRIPLRETSLLVTLFTRGSGKIRALAKGIRREKNPLTVRFEPFTRLSVVYYEKLKSDTHLISETAILDSNAPLRARLDLFGYSSYLTELVDTLLGVHDPHPEVFELLRESFRLLKTAPAFQVARVFEIKLLQEIGLLPILDHCVRCGEREFQTAFLSAKQGGILCSACDRKESGTIRISQGAVQSLRFFIRNDTEHAAKLNLSKQAARELEQINSKFIHFRLERPLSTKQFLSELISLQNPRVGQV
jgi:DNA repair protein RecO (recombination protein O)